MATDARNLNVGTIRERVPSSPTAATFHTAASPLHLIHRDATAADSPLNPQSLATAANNSIIYGNPGGAFLTCHARLRGAGSINALPELVAWGYFPTKPGQQTPGINVGAPGLWLPLEVSKATTDVTSGQIPTVSNATVATDYSVTAPVSFFLAGCEAVMVAVATAGTISGGDSTSELDIIGFFNG